MRYIVLICVQRGEATGGGCRLFSAYCICDYMVFKLFQTRCVMQINFKNVYLSGMKQDIF